MYAHYTEYLRDIMLNEHSRPLLDKALSSYPLYQPTKLYDLIPSREVLNKKLLNHWKYHEIGFETVGRFLDELEITMGEIMPRYNELFKTIEIMAELPNPFDNVDVTETFEQERHDTSEGSSESSQVSSGTTGSTSEASNSDTSTTSSTSTGKNIRSDTPQSELSITADNIDSVDYASEASWNKDTGTNTTSHEGTTSSEVNSSSESSGTGSTTSTTETSGTTKHTYTKKGNQGVNTYAHDMNEFRTSIMDVVDQIINDLRIAELFMQVY